MTAISSIGQTQAANAGFIPQLWAQSALKVLRNQICLAKLIATDADYGGFSKGSTLNIPYPGTFTAQQKTAGNPATVQQPANSATTQVTLSQYYTVDFIVEDIAQAQANSDLIDRYTEPAAIALAENLEAYLMTFYSSFSNAAVGTAGTNLNHAAITSARKALNDAKVPQANRHLVISSKDEAALIGDSTLAQYFAYAQNKGIQDGQIGRLDGFDIWMSQLVPVVNGTPNSTHNLAFEKNAMLLAMRSLPDPPKDSGVTYAVIKDDVSGLVIRVTMGYNQMYRGMYVAFDILYGAVGLRPTNGVVLLS